MGVRTCLGTAVAFEMAALARFGTTGPLDGAARAHLGRARALQPASRASLSAAGACKTCFFMQESKFNENVGFSIKRYLGSWLVKKLNTF